MNYQDRITYEPINELYPHEIAVFGSNYAGRHGKGFAKVCREDYGAIYGIGFGPQGQCYAIPTKGWSLETLSLNEIQPYVWVFIKYAEQNPHLIFKVSSIGCGLAGYRPEDIAPLFSSSIDVVNIHLPIEFWNILNLAE